jgi:hypothetical protein
MAYYELSPAYGRDYKNATEVKTAFLDGKDFEGDYQMGFRLCSIRDMKPGDTANLRYGKLRKVAVVKVPEPMVKAEGG